MASIFGLAVTEQYVSPTIVNSYGVFSQLNWLGMVERVFKLSIPVLWGWLIIFYTLFHLLLNITAEFTGFGDREFYLVGRPVHITASCTDHSCTGELAALSLAPCFYMLFHSLLKIVAEFTGFGDREVYLVCLIAMSLTVCTAEVTASMCSSSPGMP